MKRPPRNYQQPEDLNASTEAPTMPFEDSGDVPINDITDTYTSETKNDSELKYVPEPTQPPLLGSKEQEAWIVSRWRPMMAWTYMATCIFDFIIGPVFYNLLQFHQNGGNIEMWQAITLQGGGLYHVSMGAILGISALGRTKEKLAAVNSEPIL